MPAQSPTLSPTLSRSRCVARSSSGIPASICDEVGATSAALEDAAAEAGEDEISEPPNASPTSAWIALVGESLKVQSVSQYSRRRRLDEPTRAAPDGAARNAT